MGNHQCAPARTDAAGVRGRAKPHPLPISWRGIPGLPARRPMTFRPSCNGRSARKQVARREPIMSSTAHRHRGKPVRGQVAHRRSDSARTRRRRTARPIYRRRCRLRGGWNGCWLTRKSLHAFMPSNSRQQPPIVQTSTPGEWQHPFRSVGQGESPGQQPSPGLHLSRHSRIPLGQRQAQER